MPDSPPCLRSDALLDEVVVYLQRAGPGLYQHRREAVLGDGEDGGYIGIGGDYHLVARLHHAHLDVGPEYQDERIETVGTAHAAPRPDEGGIVLLKLLVLFSLEIPASIHNPADSLIDLCAMQSSNIL